MRKIGCGLLLLAVLLAPAAAQPPDKAPPAGQWPTIEEARSTSQCDAGPWAQTIAVIKALDPEQDAEKQIAAGDFSFMSGRLPVFPRRAAPTAPTSPPLKAFKKGEWAPTGILLMRFGSSPAGVHCKLTLKETLPSHLLEPSPLLERLLDATDDASKQCGCVARVLVLDYAERFNRHVLEHRAYPDKDICVLRPPGFVYMAGQISDRPTPDMIPAQIPDIATAARFGLTERVAKFIADGADVAQHDMFGFDALKWSVVRDYRAAFDLIIAAAGTPDFCAALEAAVGYDSAEAVAPLAQRCRSEKRLHLLAGAVERGKLAIVQALIDAEPALQLAETNQAMSALSSTVYAGRVDLTRLLLGRISAGQWEQARAGLLRTAVDRRNLDMVRLLLERGGDPAPGLLQHAISRKARDIVRALAEHGADVNEALPPRPQKEQPQKAAATDVQLDPLGRQQPVRLQPGDEKLDRERGRFADPPIFFALDPLMDLEIVNLLLELGANPNVRDASGSTPLMVAITHGHIYGKKDGIAWVERRVPRKLIEGQEDWEHRGVEPVRALLAKGADVALADSAGLTALHHAARSDYNNEIARLLIAHGADVNARDKTGKTPLDHALDAGLGRMPDLLAKAGARSGAQ